MSALLIVLLVLWNVGISFWNARSCGEVWIEANAIGGWSRVMVWCGAIQSVIGFSSLYVIVAALVIGGKTGDAILGLWYLLIIIPALGSGLLITLQSWRNAYQSGSWGDIGVGVYNTIAEANNIYGATSGIESAGSLVKDVFSGDDDTQGFFAKVAIVVVVGAALTLAVGTTWIIIQHYKGTTKVPVMQAA